MLDKRRAQSSLEYALIIVTVVAAFVALNSYMRKSVEGRLRSSTDQISQRQFEPSNFTISWKRIGGMGRIKR